MMKVSQRCQYGLRAVLELARRRGQGPVPVRTIAKAQAIPQRFLELIVKDLRREGILTATRGARGGYQLEIPPEELTVGRLLRLFDGPMDPVDCIACDGERDCPLQGECVFSDLWKQAAAVTENLYDNATIQDLLAREAIRDQGQDYSI